jgi:hypothetical protein
VPSTSTPRKWPGAAKSSAHPRARHHLQTGQTGQIGGEQLGEIGLFQPDVHADVQIIAQRRPAPGGALPHTRRIAPFSRNAQQIIGHLHPAREILIGDRPARLAQRRIGLKIARAKGHQLPAPQPRGAAQRLHPPFHQPQERTAIAAALVAFLPIHGRFGGAALDQQHLLPRAGQRHGHGDTHRARAHHQHIARRQVARQAFQRHHRHREQSSRRHPGGWIRG